MLDPDMAHLSYGPVAVTHVIALLVVWLWHFEAGATIEKLYWWSWFSSFLAVMISWGPVTLTYGFSFLDVRTLDWLFMATSLASADGPMFLYAIPLVMLVFVYINSPDDGLVVTNNNSFWISWAAGMVYTGLSIFYQIVTIPAIRVWYNNKYYEEEAIDDDVGEFDGDKDYEVESWLSDALAF